MRHPAIYPTVAVLAWGLMFSIFGQALHHVDAFNLTAIRYGLAATIFVLLLVAREGVAALWPAGRVRETFALGFVGFAGFNLLLGLALGHTHPQNAALMVALTPLL